MRMASTMFFQRTDFALRDSSINSASCLGSSSIRATWAVSLAASVPNTKRMIMDQRELMTIRANITDLVRSRKLTPSRLLELFARLLRALHCRYSEVREQSG